MNITFVQTLDLPPTFSQLMIANDLMYDVQLYDLKQKDI